MRETGYHLRFREKVTFFFFNYGCFGFYLKFGKKKKNKPGKLFHSGRNAPSSKTSDETRGSSCAGFVFLVENIPKTTPEGCFDQKSACTRRGLAQGASLLCQGKGGGGGTQPVPKSPPVGRRCPGTGDPLSPIDPLPECQKGL